MTHRYTYTTPNDEDLRDVADSETLALEIADIIEQGIEYIKNDETVAVAETILEHIVGPLVARALAEKEED